VSEKIRRSSVVALDEASNIVNGKSNGNKDDESEKLEENADRMESKKTKLRSEESRKSTTTTNKGEKRKATAGTQEATTNETVDTTPTLVNVVANGIAVASINATSSDATKHKRQNSIGQEVWMLTAPVTATSPSLTPQLSKTKPPVTPTAASRQVSNLSSTPATNTATTTTATTPAATSSIRLATKSPLPLEDFIPLSSSPPRNSKRSRKDSEKNDDDNDDDNDNDRHDGDDDDRATKKDNKKRKLDANAPSFVPQAM
jgi:hypothetical protein